MHELCVEKQYTHAKELSSRSPARGIQGFLVSRQGTSSVCKKRIEGQSNQIVNMVATELLLPEWKTMRADESTRELLQLHFFNSTGRWPLARGGGVQVIERLLSCRWVPWKRRRHSQDRTVVLFDSCGQNDSNQHWRCPEICPIL
jgi:hypothetical protein